MKRKKKKTRETIYVMKQKENENTGALITAIIKLKTKIAYSVAANL